MWNLWYVTSISISLILLGCAEEQQRYEQTLPIVDTFSVAAPATEPAVPKTLYDTVGVDFLMGKFDPAKHPKFVEIAAQYADRPGLYMRREAYDAFMAMHRAAQAAGVQLIIRSAARNFERQRQIWEAKWTGTRTVEGGENLAETTPDPVARAKKILLYSSMPGTSRHHWGTDIDLNAFQNSYFDNGKGKIVYNWLTANAAQYGFCQPYTDKANGRTGYEEERWHWTYLPLARPFTTQAAKKLHNSIISGFKGSETAPRVDVVGNYVLGINNACE